MPDLEFDEFAYGYGVGKLNFQEIAGRWQPFYLYGQTISMVGGDLPALYGFAKHKIR